MIKSPIHVDKDQQVDSHEDIDLTLRESIAWLIQTALGLTPTKTHEAIRNDRNAGKFTRTTTFEPVQEPTTKTLKPSSSSSTSLQAPADVAMEKNDLYDMYRDIQQKLHQHLPERSPEQGYEGHVERTYGPCTFSFTLRPYQKQALYWMVEKELSANHVLLNALGKAEIDQSLATTAQLHPQWEAYAMNGASIAGDISTFYYNPYTGDLSLQFPDSRLGGQYSGGILADEMVHHYI